MTTHQNTPSFEEEMRNHICLCNGSSEYYLPELVGENGHNLSCNEEVEFVTHAHHSALTRQREEFEAKLERTYQEGQKLGIAQGVKMTMEKVGPYLSPKDLDTLIQTMKGEQ